VNDNDTRGTGHPLDIASLSKSMYDIQPHDIVVAFINYGLSAILHEQRDFHVTAAADYAQAENHEVCIGDTTITICSGETTSSQFSKYARSQGADVVIQKDVNGNVQIFVNSKVAGIIRMKDAIRVLRIMESERSGKEIPRDWKTLEEEGMFNRWYYQKNGNMILNGSKTATGVLPTGIPFGEIVRAITTALLPEPFYPPHASECRADKCFGKKCPFYKYGLLACRGVRYREMAAAGALS
jgi:hypothetical protein